MPLSVHYNSFSTRSHYTVLIPLVLFMSLILNNGSVSAQILISAPDTTTKTTALNQTLGSQATPGSQVSSVLESPDVTVTATDSLVFRVKDIRRGTLYGSANVLHESGNLKAGTIFLDLDNDIISAESAVEADTLDQPVLTRDGKEIRSQSIAFNYKTKRGKFRVARMSVDQGNLIGNEVKNKTEHVVFIRNGIYSTCLLDHPHYYIRADKMKMVDEEEIFFTRARLYILDIPYPLIFPFGYFPAKLDRKQSGLLSPTYVYQLQSTRGLGLQNVGWFQYFNDYLTGTISGNIFTSGTFLLSTDMRYSKRGNYNGTIRYSYSKEQGLEPTDPDFSKKVSQQLVLSHKQDFNPYNSLSADINYRTSNFYKNNSLDFEEQVQTTTSSSIGYNFNDPSGNYRISSQMNLTQNFANKSTTLSGPSASFSMNPIYPFSSKSGGGNAKNPFSSLTLNYNNRFSSNYRFQPQNADSSSISWFDALLSPSKYREATGNDLHINYGFAQKAIMSTRLLPTELINVNGSMNYNEYWYPYSVSKVYKPENNKVVNLYDYGFNSARDYNLSVSANTTIYGIWNQRVGNLSGFRHTVTPQISFSYRPNFSNPDWGYYNTYSYIDTSGVSRSVDYSRFDGNVAGQPGKGESRSINFSINNIFETKLASRDTTGEKREKVIKIIDRLSFSSSYNFAANKFRLAPLSAVVSTSLIQGVSMSANASFDFYATDSIGTKINTFLWDSRKKPFRLTSFSLSAATRFSGNQKNRSARMRPYYPKNYDPLDQQIFEPYDRSFLINEVPDYSVPWQVSLNFSYSWRWSKQRINRSATLNANNIQVRITPEWAFNTRVGYDFIEKKITPSDFTLNRQLHCWNMSFTWQPFGKFRYYYFRLTVNSAQFQSLFQKLPGMNALEQSNRPTYGRSSFNL